MLLTNVCVPQQWGSSVLPSMVVLDPHNINVFHPNAVPSLSLTQPSKTRQTLINQLQSRSLQGKVLFVVVITFVASALCLTSPLV